MHLPETPVQRHFSVAVVCALHQAFYHALVASVLQAQDRQWMYPVEEGLARSQDLARGLYRLHCH